MKSPKISVIICSIEALKYARICENYKRLLAKIPHEIIGIHDATSLGEGYNRGIHQSTGDILIFSHDDIIILDDEFSDKIINHLSTFDVLGFAGASRLVSGKWIDASNQYLHGAVAHAFPKSTYLTLNVYGASEWPVVSGIKVIDGLCMIAKRQVATNIGFDAATFDGFHLYDLDFSFSSYLAGFKIGVCCDIPIIHESGGNFDSRYRAYAQRFIKKFGKHFDPPEYGRPSTTPLCNASSHRDPDALRSAWQKDSLKHITATILSAAAFQQYSTPVEMLASQKKQIENNEADYPGKNTAATISLATGFENTELKSTIQNQITTDWNNSDKQTDVNLKYQEWLAQRRFIATDTKFTTSDLNDHTNSEIGFHLIIRLQKGFEDKLADTIDSLGLQIHENWILDVVSTQPSPPGIEDVPNISWHTLASTSLFKYTIDFIAKTSTFNWLIEIPAGARLDILYLWRLARETIAHPDSSAFFVDDDCCDEMGDRHTPRFKPGTNPHYLQSADIAGPLCVSKGAWIGSKGAGNSAGSPWYDHLIRIADKYGWPSIVHIPDILLTYYKFYPSDAEACVNALSAFHKSRNTPAEVHYLTNDSWEIRYTPACPPGITVAVLSQGQLEFIIRSVSSLINVTQYPNFEILVVTKPVEGDPDFHDWLIDIQEQANGPSVRVVFALTDYSYAALCNQAMATAVHDWVVLLREEVVIVQNLWLEELSRLTQLDDVATIAPLIHHPGDAHITAAGSVLGLMGEFSSPYANAAKLGDAGYLDCLKVTRDVMAPPSSCVLVRKSTYLQVGGMDATSYGNTYAEIDLSLKFRAAGMRSLVHPRAGVVFGGETSLYDLGDRLDALSKKRTSSRTLRKRWGTSALKDLFWNPNLSLSSVIPTPETEFRAQWQYLPSDKPRILAHPLGNGQGDFRITSPLTAVRKAGLAMECVWRQKISSMARYFTAAEIAQMAPTTVIIQNYIHDIALAALDDWHASSDRPFIVYTLDDLINDLDVTNPFRKHIPPNSRSRFKYALERCDRLVLSTEYLADTYRHFISDIRVVPNRLEKDVWLPLVSERRTAPKPRVGWAGGTTHQGDLILLKEIIEQTRNEVDWVFFGMCPDELRPLIAEYHDLVPFDEYPARLATLNLDIAVAPLAITDFNRGKSNLRLLEYGALGIPVVCTDINPYQDSPACRVQNKASEWVEALRERINEPEAREREGNTMRDWVYRNFLLEDHLDQWLAAHLPE